MLSIDQTSEGASIGFFAQMLRREPSELALGNEIAGFRHSPVPKIGRFSEDGRKDRARFIG